MSDDNRTDDGSTDTINNGTGQLLAQPREKAQLQAVSEGVLPIIPRNIDEAQRYASGLIAANQVPQAFRVDGKADNPPNAPLILLGVMKSMEIGLPPQTGLEVLLPLNGRFTCWGDGPIALAQQSGKVKNYIERQIGPALDPRAELGEWPDEFGFEVRIWRVGQPDPYIGRFTVADAKRQKLWMNSYKKPWIMSPLRMLKIRARSFAIRDGFADCLMGLAIKEEVEDAMPDQIEVGQAVSKRRAALDDEPVTQSLPAPEEDANGTPLPQAEPEKQPADLLDKDF